MLVHRYLSIRFPHSTNRKFSTSLCPSKSIWMWSVVIRKDNDGWLVLKNIQVRHVYVYVIHTVVRISWRRLVVIFKSCRSNRRHCVIITPAKTDSARGNGWSDLRLGLNISHGDILSGMRWQVLCLANLSPENCFRFVPNHYSTGIIARRFISLQSTYYIMLEYAMTKQRTFVVIIIGYFGLNSNVWTD